MKLSELQQFKTEQQIEFNNIKKQRLLLEHRVNLLRDGSINKDMLDEQARRKLGYADKNDIVIIK